MIKAYNIWVQATPDCTFPVFLNQWSGAPDTERYPGISLPCRNFQNL